MQHREAIGIVIRDATAVDAPDLARIAVMAGHGLMEIFYEDLVPGKSPAALIAERRILRPGSFAELARWRVAADARGRLLGALNSFPHALFAEAEPDPLIPPERFAILDSLTGIEAQGAGSYFVNMIAVLPEHRRGGVGKALMDEAERLARRGGFTRLGLATFAADTALVDFYRRLGFIIAATAPIDPHPALTLGGDWALMIRHLDG